MIFYSKESLYICIDIPKNMKAKIPKLVVFISFDLGISAVL